MAIKIKKIDRAVSISSLAAVIDIPAKWDFQIQCPNHGEITFDFKMLHVKDREKLISQFRDAIWSMRHESGVVSLQSYMGAIKKFLQFCEHVATDICYITKLADIDRSVINSYVLWLSNQTYSRGSAKIKPLSNTAGRNAYSGLKAVLVNRQKFTANEVNPNLDFPKNPFPNKNILVTTRTPYSPSEHSRIIGALNSDLATIHCHPSAKRQLAELQILIVYLLVLAASTGANLQPLLELKRTSMRPHPIAGREILTTTKRRGRSTFSLSVRASQESSQHSSNHTIPSSIGAHFRALCEFTHELSCESEEHSEHVFLWRVSRGPRKGVTTKLNRMTVKTAIRDFARRHKLKADNNTDLALSFGRFRPTYATALYQRTRDIRTVAAALGHANADTTARSYARLPESAERNHALVTEVMFTKFTTKSFDGKIMIAADGGVPLNDIEKLMPEGYNTGIARCSNPFREDDSVCKKFFTCFRCPNMMVFEDDLWRLFSFYHRLLSERIKMPSTHWMKTYAPIIKKIDNEIAPLFPPEKVLEARSRASVSPHPAWR